MCAVGLTPTWPLIGLTKIRQAAQARHSVKGACLLQDGTGSRARFSDHALCALGAFEHANERLSRAVL